MQNLSYQAVQDVLAGQEGVASAAEAHGVLAGMLCASANVDAEHWLELVFADAREDLGEAERRLMLDLDDATRRSLDAIDFSFQLFLPDDEALLSERAEALSEWCQGFLYGLGQMSSDEAWGGESAEVLRDLSEISRLDSSASGENEEQAFVEISEFVRLGIQMIRGERLSKPSVSKHLH
jgi:yecA family protein